METKKTKYDTNPLDPEYARDTEKVWGERPENSTEELWGATRPVTPPPPDEPPRQNVYSEAPTRRYDSPALDAPYPSIFVPPPQPSVPQPQQQPRSVYEPPPLVQPPTERSIPGIGLPEKWAVMLPYAPFYIGVVVSLLELFLVPRREVKVRFHASQGLALHIAILAIQTIFTVVSAVTDSSIGSVLFKAFATVFLIISMIRVWKGEPHRISPLSDPAQWFNERIEPRKPS